MIGLFLISFVLTQKKQKVKTENLLLKMIFTSLKENNSLADSLKQIFFLNASFNHFFNAKFFMSDQKTILLMCEGGRQRRGKKE
jgi:hypothetical protein